MAEAKGMKPNEIRSLMVYNGIKLDDIAIKAGVTTGAVHQVIYSIGRYKGYRIRPYIAEAIGKQVDEIWPDGEANKDNETCKKACL